MFSAIANVYARCFLLGAVLVSGACVESHAQSYPRKLITLVVPFPPGAATDVFARAAGRRMSELLGQQIVVLNRVGASGAIGTDLVVRAAPDGYTLLWGTPGPLVISPMLGGKLPYEPLCDLAPISLFAKIPFVLVVHRSVPVRTIKELVTLAKAHPGKLDFASSGTPPRLECVQTQ